MKEYWFIEKKMGVCGQVAVRHISSFFLSLKYVLYSMRAQNVVSRHARNVRNAACKKCRISGLTLDLLDQIMNFNAIPIILVQITVCPQTLVP